MTPMVDVGKETEFVALGGETGKRVPSVGGSQFELWTWWGCTDSSVSVFTPSI
jgi:hypothetical protein